MKMRTVAICPYHWIDQEGPRQPVIVRLEPGDPREHCYKCGDDVGTNVIYTRRYVDD